MQTKRTALGALVGALALATTASSAAAADLLDITGVYTDGHLDTGTFEVPAGEYYVKFESSIPAAVQLFHTDAYEQYFFVDGVEVFHHSDAADSSTIYYTPPSLYISLFGYSEQYDYFLYPTDYIFTQTRVFVDFNAYVDPTAEGETYHLRVAAVPEPQAWLMLIGGFFGAGALLRKRIAALA